LPDQDVSLLNKSLKPLVTMGLRVSAQLANLRNGTWLEFTSFFQNLPGVELAERLERHLQEKCQTTVKTDDSYMT